MATPFQKSERLASPLTHPIRWCAPLRTTTSMQCGSRCSSRCCTATAATRGQRCRSRSLDATTADLTKSFTMTSSTANHWTRITATIRSTWMARFRLTSKSLELPQTQPVPRYRISSTGRRTPRSSMAGCGIPTALSSACGWMQSRSAASLSAATASVASRWQSLMASPLILAPGGSFIRLALYGAAISAQPSNGPMTLHGCCGICWSTVAMGSVITSKHRNWISFHSSPRRSIAARWYRMASVALSHGSPVTSTSNQQTMPTS